WLPGQPLSFNYSHSRHWLALAWSREPGEIGVDIEDLGRGQSFEALARRYFHADELTTWLAAPADQREAVWLRTWTRKEAVLKAHGLGLRLALNTLDTCADAVQHPLLGCWQVRSEPAGDAVLSLAWPA
ncbi:MAG: 4'-phosphopantetheinyl transferase superfamily protein, partial [Perlucidibaca sp.]